MLIELTITDFAIIDHLRLTLCPTLNVFTGETGAGKSIIVDAIAALVGERVSADMVRAGSARASVEGIFDVSGFLASARGNANGAAPSPDAREPAGQANEAATLGDVLSRLELEPEDGTLILAREILASGRSIARVNGRSVPLSALQQIARFLIDIHGQSTHLALLHPEQHVFYLDRYAGTPELQAQVAALVAAWRANRRELERLRQNEREIERRIELLRYQVDEIDAARLQQGELEELETDRRRLANAERLGELSQAIHDALSGDSDGDAQSAVDLVATAERALGELLRLDDTLREQAPSLEQARAILQDVAMTVRSYQEDIAADPQRQAAVEERLDLISRLRRKYGATLDEILAYAEDARRELDELLHREERMADLQAHDHTLRGDIGALASELSARRQAAARELAMAMEHELDDLNMPRARFQVQITQQPDRDGVPAHPTPATAASDGANAVHFAFSPTGIDRVEFLIAPNPGEPLKPLARIASGGETSRLMLALKTILARADIVPTLIFDEIDAGISGRSGQTVGEKLWQLGRSHQVLCVTHLPQIAALGDCHFRVSKAQRDERTTTHVEVLAPPERVLELSQMLGGRQTAAARANADDLLVQAEGWKRQVACSDA
jgi:DNA repair protein RecN (Recombination protein N)